MELGKRNFTNLSLSGSSPDKSTKDNSSPHWKEDMFPEFGEFNVERYSEGGAVKNDNLVEVFNPMDQTSQDDLEILMDGREEDGGIQPEKRTVTEGTKASCRCPTRMKLLGCPSRGVNKMIFPKI